MVILGTFFPWKASTLVACELRVAVPSGEGMLRCKFSCWRSFYESKVSDSADSRQ